MNRRALIFGLGSLVAILPASGHAQFLQRFFPSRGLWKDIPSIVVISTEGDPPIAPPFAKRLISGTPNSQSSAARFDWVRWRISLK